LECEKKKKIQLPFYIINKGQKWGIGSLRERKEKLVGKVIKD